MCCYMCVRVEFVVAVVIAAVVVRHNAESCLPPQREISHSDVSLLYVALGPLAAAGFTCFFGSESLGGMEFRPPAAAHAAVDVAVSHSNFARLSCFVLFCLVLSCWILGCLFPGCPHDPTSMVLSGSSVVLSPRVFVHGIVVRCVVCHIQFCPESI